MKVIGLLLGTVLIVALGFKVWPSRSFAQHEKAEGTSVSSINKILASREQMISSLKKDQFDILVIGGGATGAGAILDATTRGLKVALIEAEDFSLGTSSRSTKLIHGGVRYLEHAVKHLDKNEFALVRDALHERKRFLENAPHLCHALGILTPVYSWFDAFYYWMGLKTYDVIAGKASLGKSQFIQREETLERFPMLKKEGLKGAVLYFDGQFDDARMNVSLILTAIKEGGVACNYIRALSLVKADDRIVGAMVEDQVSKEIWPIRAEIIINATGPYADVIRKMDDPKLKDIIEPSQGSHILLPQSFSPPDTGLIIPKTKDGRVIFLLPWQGKTLAGTTDHPHEIEQFPKATEEEVSYILDYVRQYFDVPLERQNILATFSGFRPLAKPEHMQGDTASISRDHLIEVSPHKLVTIVGGKWTTYRKMAEDVVNRAIEVGELKAKQKSQTKNLKLFGASDYNNSLPSKLSLLGLPKDCAEHLAHAYGDQAFNVININNLSLKSRLITGFPYIEAEVIYCIRHEYALHASDILARRMRLAFLSHEASLRALPRVVDLIAAELSWDEPRKSQEITDAEKFLATMFTKAPL